MLPARAPRGTTLNGPASKYMVVRGWRQQPLTIMLSILCSIQRPPAGFYARVVTKRRAHKDSQT